jgi:hypothetical protein
VEIKLLASMISSVVNKTFSMNSIHPVIEKVARMRTALEAGSAAFGMLFNGENEPSLRADLPKA